MRFRPLFVALVLFLALAGCGRPKTFDSMRVRLPTAAYDHGGAAAGARRPPHTPPAGDRADVAALTPAQRAAFHAWIAHYWLAAWYSAVWAARDPLQPCGGDLPSCSIVARESGGDYGALNPTGCGGNACFGKYQFSGAWAGKLGLPVDIGSATPAEQDAAARELWAGGAGCSNWTC